jgi:hypothetical protein
VNLPSDVRDSTGHKPNDYADSSAALKAYRARIAKQRSAAQAALDQKRKQKEAILPCPWPGGGGHIARHHLRGITTLMKREKKSC